MYIPMNEILPLVILIIVFIMIDIRRWNKRLERERLEQLRRAHPGVDPKFLADIERITSGKH